ncbi:MAG: hypothetical protein ATN35_05835 [Epulopiscium sp. Nele67-Bin004]|nr:MAG: hypothetical protein ATN35_05835 [Epulopiscium sp. Nele67-Bin004]
MKNIIIDCDPGADDALAIMLAVHCDELNILGLTTVSGNAHKNTCSKNARDILNFCNAKNINVYDGEDTPLIRHLDFTDEYCGTNGICDYTFETQNQPTPDIDAIQFIYNCICEYEHLYIISIAPMTNIAKLLQLHPDIPKERITVITMAGYFKVNHIKKTRSEWNVLVDPEAYKLVCDSNIKMYSLGLDVTALLTNDIVFHILENTNSKYTAFLKHCSNFYVSKNLTPLSLLVDALPIAYIIDNNVASFKTGEIVISINKVIDSETIKFNEHDNSNFHVAYDIDCLKYRNILESRLFR